MRTAAETRQLVESYVKAFNSRDFDAVAAIYAEDATLEDPVGSGIHRGRAAIRAFYEQYRHSPSFLQLTGDFRYPAGAVAFTFFCYLGEGAEQMVVQITDTFRFAENGLVSEMRAFWGEANVHGVRARRDDLGDQLPLAGMVVLVTGDGALANAGAQSVAGKGAVVVIARDPRSADEGAAAIRGQGGRAFALPVDLSDEHALEGLSERAVELAGRLDACVNAFASEQVEAAKLTGRCAELQLRAFDTAGSRGAIVNVVESHWGAVMLEGPRAGPRRTARINCLVSQPGTAPTALGGAIVWLVSPMTGIDGQAITLTAA